MTIQSKNPFDAFVREKAPERSRAQKIIHNAPHSRPHDMLAATATPVTAAVRVARKTRRAMSSSAVARIAHAHARPVSSVARVTSSSSSLRVRTRAGSDDNASANDDEVPIWERREIERKAADDKGGLPWPLYLLGSVIVLIASTGSVFEYAYKNPIFGVVNADSGLYAPILGWFVFTGFPLAGWFWKKGIDGANEASELQDKIDGY